MGDTTIQIPVKVDLKTEATARAKEMGFSSLQELIRVLMTKLVTKQLTVSFTEYPEFKLSKKNDRRYTKMEKDYKEGKNVLTFKNVEDAISYLNKN